MSLQTILCLLLISISLCNSVDTEIMTEVGVGGTTEGNSIMQQNFRCVTSSVTYAVSMTTIPARIPHLRNVVESWLYQGTVQPRYIFIFIPKQYKRFKRKSNGDMGESFKCMAESILVDQLGTTPRYVDVSRDCAHFSGEVTKVADNMNSNTCTTIRVVETEVDWGPATKYVGFMDYRLSWDRKWGVNSPKLPDYWVVGDDDVRYASNTWSLYEAFILNDPVVTEREREAQGEDSPSALVGPYTVLTHFSEDCRQLVHLDREDFTRPVLHLQGVDTVAFPSRLLQMHEEGQRAQREWSEAV